LAAAGTPLVVAAGGDGTVNEVVNGLAQGGLERGSVLGVLPTGTMNVFAVELGLPPSLFLKKCWEVIEHGKVAEIDLWTANGHYFVQLAGVGMDAEVIKETSWELKRAFGPLSYIMSAANVLAQKAPTVVVTADGKQSYLGSIVLVGNGQRYGGPFKVFRDAANDDGKLDVVVVRGQGLPELIELVKAAGITGYEASEEVDYFQTEGLLVESAGGEPVAVEADGDLIGETPVTFRRAPHPLRVMVPARGRWPLSEFPLEGFGIPAG
jgi:YegS/Rv2252/BmrU family lipid kinase